MAVIEYSAENRIGLLTIHRPEALNALNAEVLNALDTRLDDLGDIACLIVTGAGEKAFVAGADISEMAELSLVEAREFSERGNAVLAKLEDLRMPTIAAINGYALGGGLELALCCDIRIASENARFGFPEVSLGIIPGYGGIQRFSRAVGEQTAKRLVFSATRFDAKEALAMRLVEQITTPDELMTTCHSLADTISSHSEKAMAAAKSVFQENAEKTPIEARNLEAPAFSRCFLTEEQRQAMRKFLKK